MSENTVRKYMAQGEWEYDPTPVTLFTSGTAGAGLGFAGRIKTDVYGGVTLAEVYNTHDPKSGTPLANGEAMAAAPELMDALAFARQALIELDRATPSVHAGVRARVEAIRQANNALAKAGYWLTEGGE